MRKTKEQKEQETMIADAFKKHGTGSTFNIFDLGKVSKEALQGFKDGLTIDEAMIQAVEKYKIKD